MPVTLTIKQVPEALAAKLRARAAANHRSLQGELMALLDTVAAEPPAVREPETPRYRGKRATQPRDLPAHGRRLTLAELWERSRELGSKSQSESAQIVRDARDARHRR
jgi:plasmid stability protein